MSRLPKLSIVIDAVQCVSLANGQIQCTPIYHGLRPYTEEEGGGPGLFTRMATAARIERHLNSIIARELREKIPRKARAPR